MESSGYVSWEEVNVSNDKGRIDVYYYLKRIDGGSDLAVIGKERSSRHISYHYARGIFSMGAALKLKSKREVIDWLNSIVSDSRPLESSHLSGSLGSSNASELDIKNMDAELQRLGQRTKIFSWLGSPSTCRKRRKHYQSFYRNGVKISVHDFVFVLAEEDKRLVAYLEDMYEDLRGNKMVVVRWFHKIDEVGINLPHKRNDREIFFSLCLQDLSIECIDGKATVLSPQHFQKFRSVATSTILDPFVCDKQFENEDVKPFDITLLKGYWKQEIPRYMNMASPLKEQTSSHFSDDSMKVDTNTNMDSGIRPRKRLRRLKDSDQNSGRKDSVSILKVDIHNLSNRTEAGNLTHGESAALLSTTETKQSSQCLIVGSDVEILSQDSGIRGCWFRALIIKKHKDKVKVRYYDVKDADNEANSLEEWILATRVAASDKLGIRINGRSVVRPASKFSEGQVFDVGTAVDVWWHDVWQEGIVVEKASDGQFHVYFPGEKTTSIFGGSNLRPSQEWLGNRWMRIKEKPDIMSCISSLKQDAKSDENKLAKPAICDAMQSEKSKPVSSDYSSDSGSDGGRNPEGAQDLSKDNFLAQLRWNQSKKRRRGSGSPSRRMHENSDCTKKLTTLTNGCERFVLPMNLKLDHENCKYMGDSLFGSAPLTSLVMSR